MNDFNIEIMKHNYLKSLEQKYNAVCFDIDGTLTKQNSREIDERAVKMIADLLKAKIPIVFITGRGSTGLKHMINDIQFKLLNLYNIDNIELKRIYALANDGARLFYTSHNQMLNECIYTVSDDKLCQLKKFDDEMLKTQNDKINNICKITYSNDSTNNKILNVRFVLQDNNDDNVKLVMDFIENLIKDYNLNGLNITRGKYKENNVIQVGTTSKDIAIETAEKLIGVPKNSMMRIGDCGDIIGNDYAMLNCEQGYSVDRTCNSVDGCFPIFDDNNRILKGVDATLFLIKKAKLLPTICLENADKKTYIKNYAKTEYAISEGKCKYLTMYNQIIKDNFNTPNGMDDVFDCSSGSIKIPMYEWEILDFNNPLKKLFAMNDSGSLFYTLRDNFNYLLRGSKNYYYFLANRQVIDGKDYTSLENVKEWYENNIFFIDNSLKALNIKYNYSDITSKKLFLGLLDNIRNIVLILINHKLVQYYNDKNVLLNINSCENADISNLYNVLYLTENLMSKICFEKKSLMRAEEIKQIFSLTNSCINKDFFEFLAAFQEKDYSKEYRTYREIDNFAENYLTVKIDSDKKKGTNNFGVCGMCYGGLELPIIYKVINNCITDILLFNFGKNISGYRNKQLVDLRRFNINNFGGITKVGNIQNDNIILLDDNVLTGKTMQLAINSLYDIGINVTNINIVRYPGINRVNQMFMKNHGAVDYNLFFEYVTGLCFQSPYSWVDEMEDISYLDSLGVFDLNREKIIECLIKNHDYKKDSEVSVSKRRLRK